MTSTPFRDCLQAPGAFAIAVELVTARGMVTTERSRALVDKARALADDPRIDVLSITDNPGGNAMLAPDTLGTDLVSRGQQVIIHLACKDWNRNALESRGWKLASEGFGNVLCLSGDYPLGGYGGTAAPVFDIDSVGLLKLYSDMNAGLHIARTDERLERTDFFLGCVVTNHKLHEREVVPQYQKLAKKVRTGARFVINQIGYNARKDDELLRYIAAREPPGAGAGERVPALARSRPRVQRGQDPGRDRHRRAAGAGRAPRRERRQGPFVLHRPGGQAAHGRSRPRLRRRLSGRPHHRRDVLRDPRSRRRRTPTATGASSRASCGSGAPASSTCSSPTPRPGSPPTS